MKSIDEKLRYLRKRIADEKGFNLLGHVPETERNYRFKVEGVGSFEYTPFVVFLISKKFVADAGSWKLAKFVNKAISQALEVLRDPPSKNCNLQGWVKIIESGVFFIRWVIPAEKMSE